MYGVRDLRHPLPPGALRLAGSATVQSEARLDALLAGGVRKILIACTNAEPVAPPGWGLVELPTLALLTPGWILQVRARGAEVRLLACGQECCAAVLGVESLADRIAARLPRRPAPAAAIRLREPGATALAAALIEPEAGACAIEDRASPLGVLALDTERCTICGACATTCPTDALVLRESDEGLSIRHDAALCVACDRCVDVCPEDAIAVTPGVEPVRLRAGAVDLVAAPHERCTVCGTQLPARDATQGGRGPRTPGCDARVVRDVRCEDAAKPRAGPPRHRIGFKSGESRGSVPNSPGERSD